jgi:hypothetical protein
MQMFVAIKKSTPYSLNIFDNSSHYYTPKRTSIYRTQQSYFIFKMYIGSLCIFLLHVLPISVSHVFLFAFFCKVGLFRPILELFDGSKRTTGTDSTFEQMESPTLSPIVAPHYVHNDFTGISNAFTIEQGVINIDWDPLLMFMDAPGDITLDENNCTVYPQSISVHDLVDIFNKLWPGHTACRQILERFIQRFTRISHLGKHMAHYYLVQ